MNWKLFKAQCHLVARWLSSHGLYSHSSLIRIISLIFKGLKEPDIIISLALSDKSLLSLVTEKTPHNDYCFNMPDQVRTVLLCWVRSLPRNPALLGILYEHLSSEDRRKKGLYYTPLSVISYILSHTVKQLDIIANPNVQILDPACGCGHFLLAAYDILLRKFKVAQSVLKEKIDINDWSEQDIHRHIITFNLWGADIDPHASEIAAVSLYLKNPQANTDLKHNILTADSLLRPKDNDSQETCEFWSTNYDYVVGNPPYVSFGLRGAVSQNTEYRQYLRREYSAAEYKISYYVLFIQRGIELLKDGGKLAFIVPDTFLLGRYYSKIRHFILNHVTIDRLAHITTRIFKNASTGYLAIPILTKQPSQLLRSSNIIAVHQIAYSEALNETIPTCCYEQSYFHTLPYERFRIFFDEKIKKIIEYIDQQSMYLKNVASGHTGIRSKTKQCAIIASEKHSDVTWRKGLISGSQVHRYGLEYRGHWINIHPNLLYKGGWQQEIIEQRKILIRQTGDTLIACIDENGFYHLNNIHSFILKNNDISLDGLLLLLNSRLMAFYYYITTMEFGRSMAQTDIETLELLPIVLNSDINRQASLLVQTMNQYLSQMLTGDETAKHKFQLLDNYINQLVYQAYRLQSTDVEYIEKYITQLHMSKNCRTNALI